MVAIREDDIFYSVSIYIQPDRVVTFSMEDRDASEFALVLAGYFKLLTGKDLMVDKEREIYVEDAAPPYLSLHSVLPSIWSYLPSAHMRTHCMAFSMPPPYHSTKKSSLTNQPCDRNMNTTITNNNHKSSMDEFGFDIHSVLSMEILEGTKISGNEMNGLIEARNDEVLRRVAEMQKMVESSESYLNEQCEIMDEYEHTPIRSPWNQTSVEGDSDCESLASSKLSSNEDVPPPGILKHSDSLILLAESINHDLSGITKGLNSIVDGGGNVNNVDKTPSSQQGTPKTARRAQGLSQILNDLQLLGNELSQSESDSESVSTPNNSPIRLRNNQDKTSNKVIRTSFGLHSPDSSVLGNDPKDNNLKEYLRQLREASSHNFEDQQTDLAAKKLKELYGFDLSDETIIETDPDLIDLRAIPPPQTPDELDALTVLDAPPSGFGDDVQKTKQLGESNLEEFLAKVIIAPPGQKITPCKELTPEEIMSFIIPPPPGLGDDLEKNKQQKSQTEPIVPKTDIIVEKKLVESKKIQSNGSVKGAAIEPEESLYMNSSANCFINQQPSVMMVNNLKNKNSLASSSPPPKVPVKPVNLKSNHVIEYPTVERRSGPFSCCTKSKKDDSPNDEEIIEQERVVNQLRKEEKSPPLELPPRNCVNNINFSPPARPPKNPEMQFRTFSLNNNTNLCRMEKMNGDVNSFYDTMDPPNLPPRLSGDEKKLSPPLQMLPPKKPPLPPVPIKPILKSPIPILKHTGNGGIGNVGMGIVIGNQMLNHEGSPVRVAGIGSPHFHRTASSYRKIDRAFTHNEENGMEQGSPSSPIPAPRANGHFRSLSDCPPVCLQNPGPDKKPQLSLLSSPQLTRKTTSVPNSPQLSSKNGHILNAETLLQKTSIAMDGLLVKLDQVAANCSAAQSAGGGNCIDEHQYQISRDNLTEQGLQLVSASKLLVVSLSDVNLKGLPENLTSCLTAFRNITELAKDLSRFTSTPLQTRNIVLKVHDVASSFRELVSVQIGPLGAGQLALQAECLANALASLLRSLRVFSP